MAAFLCWLGVRLMEMCRVLREDGGLYLHIDHTAHAWVKAMMDGIFGRKQFRNEIVWAYTGPGNTKRWFPRKHDIALDPFAGCATRCVAAERLGWQWIGMDIWAGTYHLVKQRMEDNRKQLADPAAPIGYTTSRTTSSWTRTTWPPPGSWTRWNCPKTWRSFSARWASASTTSESRGRVSEPAPRV